jgi:triphosphoribosyl-dephospho-CoA synthase CitG
MLKKLNNGIAISPAAFRIGEAAVLGMLYEVSASPSPGLVSPYSSGTHRDMDFFTFLKSTSAISHSMYLCAQAGIDYSEEELLKVIRSIGITAERNMFKATEGVNTQKGLLFLAGVVCAAAGGCIRNGEKLERINISKKCSVICGGIVERELRGLKYNEKLSNGEKLYLKHGITGVRGEIEMGLPVVLEKGLPSYEEALDANLPAGEALCHSLINIMTDVEDTTVINRCGMEGFVLMKRFAEIAVEIGGMMTIEGKEFIHDMDGIFNEKNISPGGAADLLAITVMIHELEKKGNEI